MEAFFVYLIKSGGILMLFLGAYHFFLKKETFFLSNRVFLIAGLLASFIVPLITFTKIRYVLPEPMLTSSPSVITEVSNVEVQPHDPFNWMLLVLIVYVAGVLFFTLKLIFQLHAIYRIKTKSDIVPQFNLVHVRTNFKISPFSFFRYIFYYPKQFKDHELETILRHEKVHAEELHSLDILLTEIVFILQWFNPGIWYYKMMVKQNLEFLADAKTCHQEKDKKAYQYLMLSQAINSRNISIVNPFFNSIIKKRIVMLNQNQSKKINAVKLLFVVPLLALFVMGFNTKEVVKFSEESTIVRAKSPSSIEFRSPVRLGNHVKITSGFGEARNPFTGTMEFHRGIDIAAPIGENVLASASGIVRSSGYGERNGKYIELEHKSGYTSKYLHLNDQQVQAGDEVTSGDVIGHVGNSGKSTGPHLHFEVLKDGKALNPASLVPFETFGQNRKEEKTSSILRARSMQRIELLIDKGTSDEELLEMKEKLADEGVYFSYTTVRNDNREIIDIALEVTGKGKNGASFRNTHDTSDSENGISPVVLFIDLENNLVSIGTKGAYKSEVTKIKTGGSSVWISSDSDEQVDVWNGLEEIGEHGDIVITKKDGKGMVLINGEEIDEAELPKHKSTVLIEEDSDDSNTGFSFYMSSDDDKEHKKRVKLTKKKLKKGNQVMILKDSDDDTDIEVIGGDGDFFFVDTDGKDPLYIIDGKEASKRQVKKLSPKKIATMNVIKGEAARNKYGSKAKNGVVEITTNKKKN